MDREEEIKLVAFTIWQNDGCCDGHDLDNWLKAESPWEKQQRQGIPVVVTSEDPSNAPKTSKVGQGHKKTHSHGN